MRRIGFALGVLWSAIGTLIGLLLLVGYGPTTLAWRAGALECDVRRILPPFATAQTWGILIVYGTAGRRHAGHERVHVQQWMIFGPLFLLVYPLASLVALMRGDDGYRDNAFEVDARRRADAFEP